MEGNILAEPEFKKIVLFLILYFLIISHSDWYMPTEFRDSLVAIGVSLVLYFKIQYKVHSHILVSLGVWR